jgi:hypothetical protein
MCRALAPVNPSVAKFAPDSEFFGILPNPLSSVRRFWALLKLHPDAQRAEGFLEKHFKVRPAEERIGTA